MIPYELIIPSSSRPHLLGRLLESLFAHVDQLPTRVILHDDAVFPDRREAVAALVQDWAARTHRQFVVAYADPPIKHGPSLHWLLRHVVQPYVLYSQDDHVVVRDLPIARALGILSIHGLNQIRFNKRDTMDKKGREGQEFYKVEYRFGDPAGEVTLCAPSAGAGVGAGTGGWGRATLANGVACASSRAIAASRFCRLAGSLSVWM